ncbi:MAG: DUF1697 domain-containing protein [Streptosporangiaceae bacterium]
MPRYLALLRGINVGGRNKVAMAELRLIATQLGYIDVATYIQSGNLLFTSGDADAAGHARALEGRIAEQLGVRPAVVVISAAELARTIADNPFPDERNGRCLHAVFRDTEPTAAERSRIADAVGRARANGSADDAVVVGRTLFLHTPDGFGRSELAARLVSAAAPTAGTARNWVTVTRLMEMLTDGG